MSIYLLFYCIFNKIKTSQNKIVVYKFNKDL